MTYETATCKHCGEEIFRDRLLETDPWNDWAHDISEWSACFAKTKATPE